MVMAKALPCVSPHNDARVELPQAYVVSDLCASHYTVILQTSRATRCLSLVIAIRVDVALFLSGKTLPKLRVTANAVGRR